MPGGPATTRPGGELAMQIKRMKSTTVALIVAGLLVLAVGTYTSNGGFQLAGGLFLLVAIVRAISQAGSGDGHG